MSRRPISSQGKAKPEVRSNPSRPTSSAARPKKPAATSAKEEKPRMDIRGEEQMKMNEELAKDFPMFTKECEALLANLNMSDIDLDEEMRQAGVSEELLTGNSLESIEAREKALRKMDAELDVKNADLAKECASILSRFDPNIAKELEELVSPTMRPPSPGMQERIMESLDEQEKEYLRMNEELNRETEEITKQAEALFDMQLGEKFRPRPAKNVNKNPPGNTSGIKKSQSAKQVKHLLDNLGAVERSQSHSQLEDREEVTDTGDPLEGLRGDQISADFSEVVRRIEARMGQESSSRDEQANPVLQQLTKRSVEVNPRVREIETPLQKVDPQPITTRPVTAPAPAPSTVSGGVRARGPIDDLEPPEEVGAEAIQRFLKAKLHVLQEELDRASEEVAQKDAELQQCKKDLIGKQELSSQLDKQVTSLRTQSEKQQKRLDLATRELDNSKLEIAGLKRELETQLRNQKKVDNTQSAAEVRLNRALEEVEKYKTVIQQLKEDNKDSHQSTSKKLEGLQVENKILFKQREELMTGFKKQMKLIDNLKRQKMHIEAAKMLAFSEEEFMRVLDWWKVSD